MYSRTAAFVAAGVLVMSGLATGTANAATTPTVTADVECGKVTLQFLNPTDHLFVFDYRVDGERPKHGPVVNGTIKQGPLAGQAFGPRWNLVSVDGRAGQHSHSVTLPFPEDSGPHSVTYRLAEGAEQSMFFDWQKPVRIKTDCRPNFKRAEAPSVVQPECDAAKGKLVIPADRGVTYKVRTQGRDYRTVRAGEYDARPGTYWVRAYAKPGVKLVGERHWKRVVEAAEACPTPTPTPTATDEPTATPTPDPTEEPTVEPEPTEEPEPQPTVTETRTTTRVVVIGDTRVPVRVDTGAGGSAKNAE